MYTHHSVPLVVLVQWNISLLQTRWSQEEDERLREMYRENELFLQDGGELDIESIAEAFEGELSIHQSCVHNNVDNMYFL